MKKEFKVYTVSNVRDNSKPYMRWNKGVTMYIQKGGVSIQLDEEEVKQLVDSLPKTIGGKY